MSSIQSRAMLVTLSIGMFSPRKTDKKVTREVIAEHNAADSAGKFVKQLLPEEALEQIKKLQNIREAPPRVEKAVGRELWRRAARHNRMLLELEGTLKYGAKWPMVVPPRTGRQIKPGFPGDSVSLTCSGLQLARSFDFLPNNSLAFYLTGC